MNYKKYTHPLIFLSFLTLLIITTTSLTLIFMISNKEKLSFCFSPGCFSYAAKIFKEPIDILKIGVEFGTYAFAAIGATTAIMTYINAVKSQVTTRHFQKSTEFKTLAIEIISTENSGIKLQNLNINRFYKTMFPSSTDAIFTPSTFYISIIKDIANQVTDTSSRYAPRSEKLIESHFNNMIAILDKLGLSIEEPTSDQLIILEPKLFLFIDLINKHFTDIELQLSNITREYERYV
ncbi:retron Ec48 family effector membrane protein [Pseudomonas rhodesiae]